MSDTNNSRQSAESLMTALTDFCLSDSLSEDGLREIIERHECASPNRNPNINYTFFIAACINERVNEGIIRYLLEYFPGAASATDKIGSMPLHYAVLNENITLDIVKLLIGAAPNSIRHVLHLICVYRNGRVDEGIIRYLLESFPDTASATSKNGRMPLHYAVLNETITLDIVQLLIDAAPNSIRHVDEEGWMPLHLICYHKVVDDITATEIVKLLIEKCPEAVLHEDNEGFLPIHIASRLKSPEFCRLLIEAHPGSERMTHSNGGLPLHCACLNTVSVVEYLYHLYPDAINHATTAGFFPIHLAIQSTKCRSDPAAAVDVVKFLLDCDPNVKLQKFQGRLSLLLFACTQDYNDSNIETGIQVIKVIYDARPEAIEENEFESNVQNFHPQVRSFIDSHLAYSRQARDHRLMMTPNENGLLPLHIALQNSVRLGSIKLLVKGYPLAVQSPDDSGALPLHVACQHHYSASVIQYLVELDTTTLHNADHEGNAALHHACRGAKYDTITLLLEKYNAVSVSKRNADKKLPVNLLLESNDLDRESVEYTESVFRLLRAYPETAMNISTHAKQQSPSALHAQFLVVRRESSK